MSAIRVLLADDHVLMRAGLRGLVDGIPGVEVVAEAGDGQEALRLMKQHQPDVALLDIAMPELNGLDAAERAAQECPKVKVVILSMHANEEYVLRALRAGAAGYMLKDAQVEELALALQAVVAGQTYLTPAVSRGVVDSYLRRTQGEVAAAETLTTRQREILQLIAEGHTSKQVAQKLFLSEKTVETHRKNLMERLGIRDVAGLVRYAIREGIASAER
jgi:DNA-binding NarL/FixJ family response regulator